MKILMVHNHYQQHGGEDNSFAAEVALLREHNHSVYTYVRHNDEIQGKTSLKMAQWAIWNHEVYRNIRCLIRQINPDVAHFQNTFSVISPAAYHAARAESVPVIETLRNYRHLCPNALFFRDGRVCEDCLEHHFPWPGLRHACYRESRAATSVIVFMNAFHRMIGTWRNKINIYITLTDFARQKFIRSGLPAEKIVVKPNFVFENANSRRENTTFTRRKGAIYVGRLSQEKGIDVLLKAWKRLEKDAPLTIVGDGPMSGMVIRAVEKMPWVRWLGHQESEDTMRLMGDAAFFILPSICYEGMPRTIVEAFMQGTPPMTFNLGAMGTMIEDGRTGLLCEPGSPDNLVAKVKWAFEHPEEMVRMGQAARSEYEKKYTAEHNYQMLVKIYEKAISRANSGK